MPFSLSLSLSDDYSPRSRDGIPVGNPLLFLGGAEHCDRSAQIPNATQTSVTGLKWFKIYEDGLQASDQSWGVDRMIKNKGKVSFTIPSCIPPGQYLLRHELIGKFLH